MRILLVEDDPSLLDVMQSSLAQLGHRVEAAPTLAMAQHWWRVQAFDAVLLDLNLPDGSGLTVLREARARGDKTPVIVLTARNRTDERIAGLDAGADDYVGKPFELAEVEARLRALVRRTAGALDVVTIGRLRLDRRARRIFVDDVDWALPAREFEVLVELLSPLGRVVSKRMMSDKLSSTDEALGDNALESFISRLRKRLVGTGAAIVTVRGLGYRVQEEVTFDNGQTQH
jgi:two-component system, OmpR family, response regulator